MNDLEKYKVHILNNIRTIIEECEEVQDSNESVYTKERSRLTAYDDIRDLIVGMFWEGDE